MKTLLIALMLSSYGGDANRLCAEAPQFRSEGRQVDGEPETLILARSKQHNGEYYAARQILREALSKTLGSASLLGALGSVEQDLGEYMEAERCYLRALNLYKPTQDELARISILNNLATLYLETKQYSKIDPLCEELEKLPLEKLTSDVISAGGLLNVIGSLEHARNRDDEAQRYYERSLKLLHQAGSRANVDAGVVEANIAFLRMDAGQYIAAAELFRLAIREIESTAGSEHLELIRPLINLARCENLGGHPERAEPLAGRAVGLSCRIISKEHPVTATAMLEQAAALRRLGRKKAARDLEKEAKASLRANIIKNRSTYTVRLWDLRGSAAR